mmetsp:Transcript_7454/g.10761  ORF Transcript_7454/g.10761 Transcript_7454/m.10761 type:complete len:283 (+) Transcript_7454:403-1251(+)
MVGGDGAVDGEEAAISVHDAARLARFHPMVLVQDRGVEPCVHALARTTCREGSATTQEHLEDSQRGQMRSIPTILHLPAQHEVAKRVRLRYPHVAACVDGFFHGGKGRQFLFGACEAELAATSGHPLAELVEVGVDTDDDQVVWPHYLVFPSPNILGGDFWEVLLLHIDGMSQGIVFVGCCVKHLSHAPLDVLVQEHSQFRGESSHVRDFFVCHQGAQHVRKSQVQHDWHVFAEAVEVVQHVFSSDPTHRARTQLFHRFHRSHVAQVFRRSERKVLEDMGHE